VPAAVVDDKRMTASQTMPGFVELRKVTSSLIERAGNATVDRCGADIAGFLQNDTI
jgi:hypothetical protein